MTSLQKKLMFISLGVFLCTLTIYLNNPFVFALNNIFREKPDPDSLTLPPVPPDTQWTKTYGGAYDDHAYSVQQTVDGGYIITGVIGSLADTEQVFLIKTDEDGFAIWNNTFAGDRGYSVQQTLDLGYIVAGTRTSVSDESTDVYLMKVDVGGAVSWTKSYGDKGRDAGYSVRQTSDGGYIITGVGDGNVCFIKTDSSGDSIWTKRFGGEFDDGGNAVQQTSDGGYIITGMTTTADSLGLTSIDVYLVKTDSLGDTLWTKTYGGDKDDRGHAVHQTADGGYIITGYTGSFSSYYDVYLIKTDANGDTVWTKTHGAAIEDDYGYSVQQTSDGGYIVCGATANTDSATDSMDIYLIKTDASGNHIWAAKFGGLCVDWGYSVFITSDGGYIIAGYTDSHGAGKKDIYLVKTKPILKIMCPNSGEQWQGGSTQTIEWIPENQPDSTYRFRLLFSSDSGQIYSDTIFDDLNGEAQSFEWIVPLINSSGCMMKLELLDTSGDVISEDICDRYFIIDITAPVIDSTTVWSDTSYSGPFAIMTEATDNLAGVDSAILYYKRDEDDDWIAVAMDSIGSTDWYMDSIPPVSSPGDSVRYYIEAIDGAGIHATDPSDAPTDYHSFIAGITGVEEYKPLPIDFSFGLHSNPARGQAVFNLFIPRDANITLWIYDVTGRLIATPFTGNKPAGYYEIHWNAKASSGVYFYVLESPWQDERGKLVLVR